MRREARYTLEEFAMAEAQCFEAFKAFQDAMDNYTLLKEADKDLLAVLMTETESNLYDLGSFSNKKNYKLSESMLERLARCSDKWRDHKKALKDATLELGRTKVRYYSYVRFWETIQSGLSYKKEELRKLG